VYVLGNHSGTLYVGVTGNLERRVWEHKTDAFDGFAKRYAVDRLLYFEEFDEIEAAIAREKQLKRWRREKKLRLVEALNSGFDDLAESWFDLD
jgi:putative endonuclease